MIWDCLDFRRAVRFQSKWVKNLNLVCSLCEPRMQREVDFALRNCHSSASPWHLFLLFRPSVRRWLRGPKRETSPSSLMQWVWPSSCPTDGILHFEDSQWRRFFFFHYLYIYLFIFYQDGLWLVSQQPSVIQGYHKGILTPNFMEFTRLYESLVS